MALNNVTFTNTAGGLGRLPADKDHISAIICDISGFPLSKRYRSIEEAEADGITEGSVDFGILHYHIKSYFETAGNSILYVINASGSDFTPEAFLEATNGDVRQVFAITLSPLTSIASVVQLYQEFANQMDALYAPLVFVIDATGDVSTSLTDLKTLNAPNVSVLISGDNSETTTALATSLGLASISAGGMVLGLLSKAQVNENVGWVEKFPLGSDKAVLTDGTSVLSAPASLLEDLNDKGYMFFRRHQGIGGIYVNDTYTCVDESNDLYSLENNRTLHKAKRGIRAILLPDLLSPLTVDTDGYLAPDTIKYFENKVSRVLDSMQNAGEVSGYVAWIDPGQNVLATGILNIMVRIQPRGVAREINVNIGFTTKLA